MTAKERLEHLLCGEPADRPPFMPAIYDLKPALIHAPAHTFAQHEGELIRALSFEAEELDADALTVAYDIYNIEAEAVGCTVLRNPQIHMPEIKAPLIHALSEIGQLQEIQKITGRMGLFIQATEKILKRYGDRLPVRGGISGPFSMATKIYPRDALLLETVIDPESVKGLLRYCTDVIKLYASAYAGIGAGVIVFDSFVAPPMIAPDFYHSVVLPFHREIFSFLKESDVLQRTLIVGGNTLPLIEDFISTGATQFLLDFNIPVEKIKPVLQQYPDTLFRVNLSPLHFTHNREDLQRVVYDLLRSLSTCRNLIIGTGILPPDVPPSNILAAKEAIVSFYK